MPSRKNPLISVCAAQLRHFLLRLFSRGREVRVGARVVQAIRNEREFVGLFALANESLRRRSPGALIGANNNHNLSPLANC